MSRRTPVVSTKRRASILSVGGQVSPNRKTPNFSPIIQNQLDDEQITNQEIVEKLLSKEEQRKLERERLIAELEKEDENGENEEEVKNQNKKTELRKCPYLDTINRATLDFDFEKLCSVSLSHMNVYCCLICGKYFQGKIIRFRQKCRIFSLELVFNFFKGRGKGTHAYTHALDCGHHVFLNLHTARFYCLPDNYEVYDASLDDILYQVGEV